MFQATSPVNPAEGCLTPPPETASPSSSQNEAAPAVSTSSNSSSSGSCSSSSSSTSTEESNQESAVDSSSPEVAAPSKPEPVEAVKCQDASNQTETPPVSEDEGSRDATTSEDEVQEESPLQVEDMEPESEQQMPQVLTPECYSLEEKQVEQAQEVELNAEVQMPPPVDVSGLELLSNSIEQFVEREKEAEKQSVVVPEQPHMIGGLGLLCALAEQRFFEDMEVVGEKESTASREDAVDGKVEEDVMVRMVPVELAPPPSPALSTPEKIDVNRNYKSPKSEKKIKKFIASKVSQYGENAGAVQPTCAEVQSTEYIDAMELNLRMRLAELQKKYKAKQKELSKLQHPRRNSVVSDDSIGSPSKRGPGRPRKRKLSPVPSPKKPKIPRESEKVIEKDESVSSKSKSKEILKPPTLNTNKILTSPKFKPSLTEKFKAKADQEKNSKEDDVSSSSGNFMTSGAFLLPPVRKT
jgi:hypothetical protein